MPITGGDSGNARRARRHSYRSVVRKSAAVAQRAAGGPPPRPQAAIDNRHTMARPGGDSGRSAWESWHQGRNRVCGVAAVGPVAELPVVIESPGVNVAIVDTETV